ncbi:hypothetical protein MMC31_004402 [Peltigera leucophlebia]|nr:hypothetical protein [Peltigera leucophlebia]
MKIFTIPTAFALCAAVTQAAPTAAEGLEARQGGYPYGPNANCTFYGPIGVEYERSVPLDSHQHFTGNAASISKIYCIGGDCDWVSDTFVDTHVLSGKTVDVGPPQPQQFGVCRSAAPA